MRNTFVPNVGSFSAFQQLPQIQAGTDTLNDYGAQHDSLSLDSLSRDTGGNNFFFRNGMVDIFLSDVCLNVW
jgi:hypothetical protein